ncbi:OmpP1/FadL family transporter [Endozoicomonas sp. Mp262]|uniref:OmpP1/FadL family transporter n=1 Tax=Endozoicomonas sp. Mp262 TaxID=2919499 RepID=UPI0021E0CC58
MQFPFNRKVLLASAVALATQASFIQAAGFSVNEHSASSMGTAYAGRASNAEDASIGAANPAGIALLDSHQVTVGSAVVLEGGNFENGNFDNTHVPASSSKSENFLKTTAVPFGHYVLPVNDKFTFGLNAYAPFGLNLDYDDEFAGRYFGDKTLIENVNLQSTFAYKIQENLSIGIGLTASYLSGELTQKKYKNISGVKLKDIDAVVKGDDLAFTWNVGVIWKPSDVTTLGASYHAATKFKLTGDITATNINVPLIGNLDFKHKGELEVTMPERVIFSGTHQLNEQWTVMADAAWTRWSQLDSITIVDKEATSLQNGTTHVPMNWRNVWALSVGTAYKVNDQWTLKTGYMFDQSPTTDDNRTVRAPDNDRHWLTAGAKWNATKDMTFDFSAAYVMLKDGKITENAHETDGSVDDGYGTLTGEYKDQASWVLSAQMTYRF